MATGWPPPFTFEWRRLSPAATFVTNVQIEPVSFYTLIATHIPTTLTYRAVVKSPSNPGGLAASFVVTTLADGDSDGIPDQWWADYGFAGSIDPMADSDGDGMLNWQEFVAGTDPTNVLSVLRLDALTTNHASVLTFEATSNKTYTLQFSGALGDNSWLKLGDFLARSNNRVERVTNALPVSNWFYRVVTPQQPSP